MLLHGGYRLCDLSVWRMRRIYFLLIATYVVPEPAVTMLKASSRSRSRFFSSDGSLLCRSSWNIVLCPAFSYDLSCP